MTQEDFWGPFCLVPKSIWTDGFVHIIYPASYLERSMKK